MSSSLWFIIHKMVCGITLGRPPTALTALRFTSCTQGFCWAKAPLLGAMQGMEKDIILLATTITHAGAFATDAQRVNVALTRARHHLIVLGCSQVLRTSSSAFRLLLSSCQMLPAGACLVLPGTLSNLSSTTTATSACADGTDDRVQMTGNKHSLGDAPMFLQGDGNSQGQAGWAVCSDAGMDGILPVSTQTTRGVKERPATVLRCPQDVSPLGEVRDGSLHAGKVTSMATAASCPKPTMVKYLGQATPPLSSTHVAAPTFMFNIDDT